MDSFQNKYQDFVKDKALPEKNGDKVFIKYFAKLEKIVEKPVSRLTSDKFYIWTRDHVKNYMSGKTAFIWIPRIYILKEP